MSSTLISFWGHIGELRNALIKSFAVICISICIAFAFYQEVFNLLTYPLHSQLFDNVLQHEEVSRERIVNPGNINVAYNIPPNARIIEISSGTQSVTNNTFLLPPNGFVEIERRSLHSQQLVVLGPLNGFIACLKTSFWVGLIGSSPLWLYFILQFIVPGLHLHERSLVYPFLALSFLFTAIGFAFGYFITVPTANQYLQSFNETIGTNMWSLESYLSYSVTLLLASAFIFEIFVILLFLVHFGIMTADWMRSKRRHMIVAAFIIAALLTPPDVLTQFLLAIPLIILYELALLYAWFRFRQELTTKSQRTQRGF